VKPYQKNLNTNKKTGGVAQDVDPEFKPRYCKKKKKKKVCAVGVGQI
jgi:hypothetical protein